MNTSIDVNFSFFFFFLDTGLELRVDEIQFNRYLLPIHSKTQSK